MKFIKSIKTKVILNKNKILGFLTLSFLIALVTTLSYFYWDELINWFSTIIPDPNGDPLLLAMVVLSLTLCFLLMGLGIVYYTIYYRKKGKKVLTTKKTIILAFFFSVFLVQSFITRYLGNATFIPFSLDTITIIIVGFVFGPLEGIIFGAIADICRVLINGWTFQLLSFFMLPLLGLLSGMVGLSFFEHKKEETYWSKFTSTAVSQAIIFGFVLFGCIAAPLLIINVGYNADDSFYWIMTMVISLVSLILIEITWYFSQKQTDNETLYLFCLILLINVVDRVFNGYFLRSLSNWMYYGLPFEVEVIKRMLTGTYLIPIRTVVSFVTIKYTLFSIEQTGGIAKWQ